MKYEVNYDLYNYDNNELINNRINKNSNILLFGFGNGLLARYLYENKNCTIDIVDNAEKNDAIVEKYANRALVGNKIGNIENFEWVKLFSGNLYDYIIFYDVLECLYSPIHVLSQCIHFLKNNGSILCSVYNITHSSMYLNNSSKSLVPLSSFPL